MAGYCDALTAIEKALDEGLASRFDRATLARGIEKALRDINVMTYQESNAPRTDALTVSLRLDASAMATRLRRIADACDQE